MLYSYNTWGGLFGNWHLCYMSISKSLAFIPCKKKSWITSKIRQRYQFYSHYVFERYNTHCFDEAVSPAKHVTSGHCSYRNIYLTCMAPMYSHVSKNIEMLFLFFTTSGSHIKTQTNPRNIYAMNTCHLRHLQ